MAFRLSPTSISQVKAITNLHDIFESWHLIAPPSFQPPQILMPGCPRVPTQEHPRLVLPLPPTPAYLISSSPSWSPQPRPAVSTLLSLTPVQPSFQATPQHELNFTGAPSPRVGFAPRLPSLLPLLSLPAQEPIAHCACSQAPALTPLALVTAGRPLHECVTGKTMQSPVEPIGFTGLCRAMPPTEVSGFAGLPIIVHVRHVRGTFSASPLHW